MAKTNLIVNISGGPTAPSTGMITQFGGGVIPSAAIFGGIVVVLVSCGLVASLVVRRKKKSKVGYAYSDAHVPKEKFSISRKSRNIFFGLVAILSIFSLGLLGVKFLGQNLSFAENGEDNLTVLSTENLILDTTVANTNSVSVKDTITIEEPTEYGYTLTITPENLERPLVNKDDTEAFFANLPTVYPNTSSMTDKTFGISLLNPESSASNTIYSGFPIVIKVNEATPANKTIDIYYTIKQAGLVAGTYTGEINITAVKNGEPVFSGITTMQQMTDEVCSAETTPLSGAATETRTHTTDPSLVPTTQLKDVRDNKLYWVAKLADGKCWMTQNLDFDLTTTLSPATSNVSSDWTPERTTIPEGNLAPETWTNDSDRPYSYDRGNYYSAGGTATTLADASALAPDAAELHYHVGNYYNWSAAVATNDTSSHFVGFETMPDSICPKGWKLPLGSDSSLNGDFNNLNTAYGNTLLSDSYLLAQPVYFARSGDIENGSLDNTGVVGFYWSNTVSSSDWAFRIYFYGDYVNPKFNWYRGSGVSVRCIAE